VDTDAVEERVRCDRRRDRPDEEQRARVAAAAGSPDEHHAATDQQHAADLGGGRPVAEEDHRDGERQHRREASRERIDERHFVRAVRVGEGDDVGRLAERGRERVRPNRCVGVPPHRRERGRERDREEERRRRRGLDVARPAEQQVPRGVQDRGSERER